MEAKAASLQHEDRAETQVDYVESLISGSQEESQTAAMEIAGSGGDTIPAPSEKQDVSPGVQISVDKKHCHQCRRRKTLLVTCKKPIKNKPCRVRICRECLWNRYAEMAEEINALPQWSCPRCRGTCSCSICMRKRNLEPTGSLHRKAKATKRVGTSVAESTSTSPVKEVLLLRWTEEWEKENAIVSSGESIKD